MSSINPGSGSGNSINPGNPGDGVDNTDTWSQYPATQNVNFGGFTITNAVITDLSQTLINETLSGSTFLSVDHVFDGDMTVSGDTSLQKGLTTGNGGALASGWARSVQLGQAPGAYLIEGGDTNPLWKPAIGTYSDEDNTERRLFYWTGNKAGNQRTTDWGNASVIMGEELLVGMPIFTNGINVNGSGLPANTRYKVGITDGGLFINDTTNTGNVETLPLNITGTNSGINLINTGGINYALVNTISGYGVGADKFALYDATNTAYCFTVDRTAFTVNGALNCTAISNLSTIVAGTIQSTDGIETNGTGLNMNSTKITLLGTPTVNTDGVNKLYVDSSNPFLQYWSNLANPNLNLFDILVGDILPPVINVNVRGLWWEGFPPYAVPTTYSIRMNINYPRPLTIYMRCMGDDEDGPASCTLSLTVYTSNTFATTSASLVKPVPPGTLLSPVDNCTIISRNPSEPQIAKVVFTPTDGSKGGIIEYFTAFP